MSTKRSAQIVPLMTAERFERLVRDYARFSHMVNIVDHVTEDRSDRRINRKMIMRTLLKGQALEKPKWDADHHNWVGRMRRIGTGIDMTAVCAIREGVLTVTVVTVYGTPKP